MALQAGTRLGPYEVVSPIGRGGMGEVWLASERRLGRKVALKLLPADLTRDADRIQRFELEARAASALNHPNVCTIYALGEASEGQHYIAMEFVEGETLRQRLSTRRLSIREALDVGRQVAAALSAAHAAGIIHRDIKPENLMLGPDGLIKVLDFGLAKLAPLSPELTAGDTTRTALHADSGTILGTLAYMSPEHSSAWLAIAKAVALVGGGFDLQDPVLPEVDALNFTPRIRAAVLMVNGRYDFDLPVDLSQKPMLRLFGAPDKDKRHAIADAGHIPPKEFIVREVLDWFDRYLGLAR